MWVFFLICGGGFFPIRDDREYYKMGDRKRQICDVLEKMAAVKELSNKHSLDLWDERILKTLVHTTPFFLHDDVFVPTIMNQASSEQVSEWLPKVMSYEWIGSYSQTEIAHGSNVRGLQTIARYMPAEDCFDVHTPSIGAVKYWPGCLGLLSTHTVLYARLVIGDVDHGIHSFLVQLRNIDTHQALPGIEVGDIGVKMSTNDNDNGYLRFDHVKIPRTNMLMKYSQVDPSGAYHKSEGPSRASYGTMTRVRAGIVMGASHYLINAITIAIRYSIVRCQEPGKFPERSVLNYVTQQYRLLPILSNAFALLFVGQRMLESYF